MRPVLWLFAGLACLGSLAACGSRATTYAVTPEAARNALAGTTIPDLAFGYEAHAEPARATGDVMVWHIDGGDRDTAAGPPILLLVAKLVAVQGGTEVSLDIQPAAGADRAAFDRTVTEQPAVHDLFVAIAGEAVDAGLAHRAFDVGRIRTQMALAALSMLPQIQAEVDRAASAHEQQERKAVDDAYRAAGEGAPGTDPAGPATNPQQ
jgi:hypothetical protein